MTNLLKEMFYEIDQDKVLINNIITLTSDISYRKAILNYNYNFYTYLHNLVDGIEPNREHLFKAIYYFVAKEKQMSLQIPALNNSFQMAISFAKDDLLNIIILRRSNLLQINSDAAAIGALMALHSKIYHTTKTEIFAETLFIAKSMV